MNRKELVYASYGIIFDASTNTINAPCFGFIKPLLKQGNTKTGKPCFTYSTLPTNSIFDRKKYSKELARDMDRAGIKVISGTCSCNCRNAYCKEGHYRHENVLASLFRNTYLQRAYPDWAARAIRAQIDAEGLKIVRIHAVGDLEKEAVDLFLTVCPETPSVQYWTYTKNKEAEQAFDSIPNVNIVKSLCPDGDGGTVVNFGKCGDVARLYRAMKKAGYSVYLCPCGIDKEHDVKCSECKKCASYDYVLFIMHSVKGYDAKKDPDLKMVLDILEEQKEGR